MGANAIRWWAWRGVALSLVVIGVSRRGTSQLEAVLDAIMVERPGPPHKHLCADAGYTGAPALKVIEDHGYIPHVKGKTLDRRSDTQLVQPASQATGAI